MRRGKECPAEIIGTTAFGVTCTNKHCDLAVGGDKPCILGELADSGLKVKPQSLPCLRGYPDNFPKIPSEN